MHVCLKVPTKSQAQIGSQWEYNSTYTGWLFGCSYSFKSH